MNRPQPIAIHPSATPIAEESILIVRPIVRQRLEDHLPTRTLPEPIAAVFYDDDARSVYEQRIPGR